MTTTTDTLITAELAATVANALTDRDALEKFVAELPAESVAIYLVKLLDAQTNARALVKGLERRLAADQQVGNHWTFGETKYGFFGSQRKGYSDFPGLVRFLIESCGMSPLVIADATSDARVTELRAAASELRNAEKRAAALEEIESHRISIGARGEPHFQAINDYNKAS